VPVNADSSFDGNATARVADPARSNKH